MKKIFIIIPILLFFSCGSTPSKFNEVEYYKSDNKDRIFLLTFKEGTTESEIRQEASRKMNTQGRMTGVYFFKENATLPSIWNSYNIFNANERIFSHKYSSQIKYGYMKYRVGTIEFINCSDNPKHLLCGGDN
ncbi:MAG: hypothetical protein H8E60_07115 [Candidatus Marinimicrobia bacterium]|nr:hypothetical protein [Candidatus Neomarinimicrobiota bacterium]